MKQVEEKMTKAGRNKVVKYGCSHCRHTKLWGGEGCDSAACNPHKYLKKMQQLLEAKAYNTEEWEKRAKQLLGGRSGTKGSKGSKGGGEGHTAVAIK